MRTSLLSWPILLLPLALHAEPFPKAGKQVQVRQEAS